MAEDKTDKKEEVKAAEKEQKAQAVAEQTPQPTRGKGSRNRNTGGRGRGKRSRSRKRKGQDDEFDSRIISIRRVSRSYKGGRRLRISVAVVVGDRKGMVGVGVGKGSDVRDAQAKAVAAAKSSLVHVPLQGNTVPHDISYKLGAAKIFIKPAAPGTGLIAGGPVRAVLEMAGVKDVLSKIYGTRNQINNAYATLSALKTMRLSKL